MILAALVFFEHDEISTGFYLGTAFIIAANLVYPLVRKHQIKRLVESSLLGLIAYCDLRKLPQCDEMTKRLDDTLALG